MNFLSWKNLLSKHLLAKKFLALAHCVGYSVVAQFTPCMRNIQSLFGAIYIVSLFFIMIIIQNMYILAYYIIRSW